MSALRLLPALLWAGAVLGCASDALLPPVVQSVTPTSVSFTQQEDVTVTLDAVLPHRVDYGSGEATVESEVEVLLGARSMGSAPLGPERTVTVPFRASAPPGTYDVRVRLADGREGALTQAFTVTAGQFPDGYAFDAIGPQQEDAFFEVTVRAQGPFAATFNGRVTLGSTSGRVIPSNSDPFVDGVLVQRLRVRSVTDPQIRLTAEDARGITATSNSFAVQQ